MNALQTLRRRFRCKLRVSVCGCRAPPLHVTISVSPSAGFHCGCWGDVRDYAPDKVNNPQAAVREEGRKLRASLTAVITRRSCSRSDLGELQIRIAGVRASSRIPIDFRYHIRPFWYPKQSFSKTTSTLHFSSEIASSLSRNSFALLKNHDGQR